MLSAVIAAAVRFRLVTTRLLIYLGFREESFFLLVAVVVGIVTAAAAVLFHELIVVIRDVLFAGPGEAFLYGPGLFMLVLVPVLGGLLVGFISRKIFNVKGIHGLVDVMESVIRMRGFTKPTVAIEKTLSSAITIGTGGSVGAEAPIVQIGAAIASAFGHLFGIARQHMPLIIGCGSAAGISSIFNAPIGGVLFTLEVILQDFSIRTFAPLVVASVVANVTTKAILQQFLGHEYDAIFAIHAVYRSQQIDIGWAQIPAFLVLGIVAGLLAVSLTRLLVFSEHSFEKLPVAGVFKPAIGAFMLGILGVAYVLIFGRLLLGQPKPIPFEIYPIPAFFSDGYGAIQPMLSSAFYNQFTTGYLIGFLLILCVLKVIGVCLTVGSGGGGGVIGPALFLGATVGGLLGSILRLLGAKLQPELYALVGMAAVLSAVIHAPLASILILVELTQDYKLILPGMLAAVVSVGVARAIFRESVYTQVLKDRGISLGESTDLRLLRRLNVEQVDFDPSAFLRVDQHVGEVIDDLERTGVTDFVVLDRNGEYAGMLVTNDLITAIRSREVLPLLVVGDLTRYDIPSVRTSDDLGVVLDRFSVHDIEHLPVTTDRAPKHVIGMISRANLLRRYRLGVQQGG